MIPSLELLANMSYQAKVVEIMAAHVHDRRPLPYFIYLLIYLFIVVVVRYLM